MKNLTQENILEKIFAKFSHHFGITENEATYEHYYKALALIVKDILSDKRSEFESRVNLENKKQMYYICMEFLLGRSLRNNLFNLGLENVVEKALKKINVDIKKVYEQEPDAGLGNGGLGRLAACFLDSLASCEYPAIGYCLKYEYGIFKQKLIEGWQTELPDFWLPGGAVWLESHPEKSVDVTFDGKVIEYWDGVYHNVKFENATTVTAVPFDILISGYNSKGVSKLRLWSAISKDFDMKLFNQGEYVRAMEQNAMAEVITKVLYPEDNHPEGKSLRLSQQYFLVSATVQDIVRRHLKNYNTLDNLHEKAAIHLNDTHPVLSIPELMRVMLDECGYSWEKAWDIVTKTISYTNHTVMSEALECWSIELLQRRLPRIYQIIEEINRRFCDNIRHLGIDNDKIFKMAIIKEGLVNMANLAAVASYAVNGVSELHSEIIKSRVFKEFYTITPGKFKNVTNGIAYRRWLNQANPRLASLISDLIGDDYLNNAEHLQELLKFKDEESVLRELSVIKQRNKVNLSNFIKKRTGIDVDPDSIYDMQIKRLHEYKRQHLNALNIVATYQWLLENPNEPFVPKTYIFAAKAAPGYYVAKQIIKFIVNMGKTINNDKRINDKLKVVYLEDYNVSLAEKLIPAAEISEQISLAGTEASGTSNMKFMINGAVTLGTLDGANVEIRRCVGPENIIIFGMNEDEVKSLRKSNYNPKMYYDNSMIKKALDRISEGFYNTRFDDIVSFLTDKDPYMVLADFADYHDAQKIASNKYSEKLLWNKISFINIANSGLFSADRAVKEYANKIWNLESLKEE